MDHFGEGFKHICELFPNKTEATLKHAIGAGDLKFDSRIGQINTVSPTARHRCDGSSELCSPDTKPRRWAPPLVTRFGVYREYNKDLILMILCW